ncbi:hypothetical protein COEX109129_26490 [Corallococcus exiguus]
MARPSPIATSPGGTCNPICWFLPSALGRTPSAARETARARGTSVRWKVISRASRRESSSRSSTSSERRSDWRWMISTIFGATWVSWSAPPWSVSA